MPVQQQNPDGSWSPATPIGWQAGYDAEIAGPIVVRGHKHYAWVLYHDGEREVAAGTSRTRLGARVRLLLAKRADQLWRRG